MASLRTETELVKDFFKNNSKCQRLRLTINFNELKNSGGFVLIEDNLLYKLDLLNTFLGTNNGLFHSGATGREKEDSYLLNYNLIGLNPALDEGSLKEYFAQIKCKFKEDEIILYDLENDCFVWIGQTRDFFMIDVFYCLENDAIKNIRKDFSILMNSFESIFHLDDSSSIDPKNSILYYLLLERHSNIFSKQDHGTKKLIREIGSQFFDAQTGERDYAYYSIIALIALILEQNLTKIYYSQTGNFPPEASTIGSLNRINTGHEYCNLRDTGGGNYELLFRSSGIQSYSKSDRIYNLCNNFASNIRNKVFHYLDGAVLNMEETSFQAIRYLVNILMEVEDNDYF